MALLVWLMGRLVIRFDPDSYCAPDPLSTAHRTTGHSVDTTCSEFNQGCQDHPSICCHVARLCGASIRVVQCSNCHTSTCVVWSLTALFNSSNSEAVLIISALFVPYLHSLFLHPFFLHPFLFSRRVLPAFAPIARLLRYRRAIRL